MLQLFVLPVLEGFPLHLVVQAVGCCRFRQFLEGELFLISDKEEVGD